jgi:hypothetical protein
MKDVPHPVHPVLRIFDEQPETLLKKGVREFS